jgi:hypothetical protein
LLLTTALVVTLVLLVFARDISRSAHGAITNQRSENRSFAGLANALIVQQNNFDVRMAALLSSGSTLSRPDFDARLDQLDQQLQYWSSAAELLRRPTLTSDVNDKIADITEQRVDDYQALVATIAHSLSLPDPTPNAAGTTGNVAQSLIATATTWNRERSALHREPGRVRLDALSSTSAQLFASSGVNALTASSSLAVVRGIGIAAVSVVPAPLPSMKGVIVLPPVSKFQLGISVVNTGFVEQALTLEVIMTPSNGPLPAERQTFNVVLAPLQSYAFAPKDIATVPSERATLDIRVTGAPDSPHQPRSELFKVEMSPSGHS